MDSKVFQNGAIATKQWVKSMSSVGLFIVQMLIILLIAPAGILWLITLGHINLVGIMFEWLDNVVDKFTLTNKFDIFLV